MALFGGAGSLFGPLLGAVPLVLLFEVLTATFPNYFSILLGLVFVLIVYGLPNGVIGFLEQRIASLRRASLVTGMSAGAECVIGHVWKREAKRELATGAPVLQVDDVRKAFGGLKAVDGLSFTLARGEILGLIGPNGSGKTTALNLISGAALPDSGDIRLEGRPIAMLAPHRIAQRGVARTFQLVRVLGASTCLENVIAGLAFHAPPLWGAAADARARALIARVGLAGREDTSAGQLTYIDQKRLNWRALWRSTRMCCCLTNGSPASIRRNCRTASRW
jgi:branched-chain amino acid transport system permease protein